LLQASPNGCNVIPYDRWNYAYVAAAQTLTTPTNHGIRAAMTVHDPFMPSVSGYHSVGEIVAGTQDGKQLVEVGWNKEHSDVWPELFVFHWRNGLPTCYNGCGYVQVSSNIYPGMPLSEGETFLQIVHWYNNVGWAWWIYAYGEWIGYFPDSLWNNQFTNVEAGQWFGEVSMPNSTNLGCAWMGNGLYGSQTGAAGLWWMQYSATPDWTQAMNSWYDASPIPNVTDPSCYDMGNFASSSFNWGGPGLGCP
jgi:hypothetical protein